jgi:hypothetical protein
MLPKRPAASASGDKSHVSLEQHECVVCGTRYDTGALLLNKRLAQTLDKHTVTGLGLCPSHQKLADDGFVALVEAEQRDGKTYRLGRLAHVRAAVWPNLFNIPLPPRMVAFVEPDAMDKLEALQARIGSDPDTDAATGNLPPVPPGAA